MSFTAVLWGLLGFMAGFLAGSVWRHKTPKAVPARPRKGAVTEKPKRWSREQWIGPVVLLLAIGMGAQYFVQVNRERDTSDCQTEWNLSFAKQLSIRSELSSQAQANVDSIILSIGKLVNPTDTTPSPSEQAKQATEYRKLFTDFAKESAAISKKRTETPLPTLPECGRTELPASMSSDLARIEALEANIDASRLAILAQQSNFNDSDPASQTPAARVIAVQPPPAAKPSVVVVEVPADEKPIPVAPPPVLQPPVVPTEVPVAEPVCTIGLLGLCVGL